MAMISGEEGPARRALMAMSLEHRIRAVTADLQSRRMRYASIDAHDLAEALGIDDTKAPGRGSGDWSWVRYAEIVSVEKYAQIVSPPSEVVYLIENQVDSTRFAELVALSSNLDAVEDPKFDLLTRDERRKLEIAIAATNLESHASNGMNCLAHISVAADGIGAGLHFEAVVEDDGTCIFLRTPYDEQAREFQQLDNCVTDCW